MLYPLVKTWKCRHKENRSTQVRGVSHKWPRSLTCPCGPLPSKWCEWQRPSSSNQLWAFSVPSTVATQITLLAKWEVTRAWHMVNTEDASYFHFGTVGQSGQKLACGIRQTVFELRFCSHWIDSEIEDYVCFVHQCLVGTEGLSQNMQSVSIYWVN